MSKHMTPIKELTTGTEFPLDLGHVLASLGLEGNEDFTYTMRVSVEEHKRRKMRRKVTEAGLADGVTQAELDAFFVLMDANDWDVSFLVDTY